MHDLQLVGFTTDRRGLIFRAQGGARADSSFIVPITDELVSLVAQLGEEHADVEPSPVEPVTAADAEQVPVARDTPRSQMSVRDIQARLRAGEAVSRIAAEAGVDDDWIERFAPPIRAEQQRIVERALEHHLRRARSAPSAVPLRRAVGMSLADKGIAFTVTAFEAAWSARLLGHARWAVEFTYRHRGRDRTATWIYDVDADELTTTDRSAAQLGYVTPGATDEGAGEAVDGIVGDRGASTPIGAATEEPAPKPASKKAPARTPAAKRRAAGTASTKKAAASRKKAAAKKAAPKKKVKAAAEKAAPKKKASAKKAGAKKKASSKASASRKPPAGTAPAKKAEKTTSEKAAPRPDPPTSEPRMPDEPRGPRTVEPDPAPPRPAGRRLVAGRPGEVPIGDASLAARGAAPSSNGHGSNGRPADDTSEAPDPASARRARAAQRSTPTVQFRGGSATPVRAVSPADGEAARPAEPEPDQNQRPASEPRASNGAARPATRRRRQLRAR